ncbi:DUF302 domain-containing protein [Caballeronia mineralivorans]|jgi:hypothetical protein|uniref:DUF302 domain-containing protein n=1 Tax=Caballeronia mineralivorans TaxID=2010198 RepID=UPI002AFFFE19|nr:DUF302 domain-containing protein [Caballeronia mineralivorans]MEA3104287.1 hypothetical protein [Caballeronia mineralivorans]
MKNESKVTERGFAGVRVEVATTASFDTVLSRLRDLTGQATLSGVIDLAKTDISEAEYVNEVERKFVGSSGFMFFSAIDHGAWIGKFGIKRRTIRWILGNPLIAITMIRHDLTAGLFAPVELLLTECEGGEGYVVTYVRPSSLISINDTNPGLKEAAVKLDSKFDALILNATTV